MVVVGGGTADQRTVEAVLVEGIVVAVVQLVEEGVLERRQ